MAIQCFRGTVKRDTKCAVLGGTNRACVQIKFSVMRRNLFQETNSDGQVKK